jgi:hypothetical protein
MINLRIGLILILFLLLTQSCTKDDIDYIDILTMIVPVEIPAGLNPVETHYFEYRSEPTRIGALLQANNILESDVSFIRPRQARLRSLAPDGTFGFVDISTVEIGSFQEDFVESFYRDRIPNDEDAVLDYIPNEVNLRSRLLEDFVDVRISMQLQGSSRLTFRSELELSFFIQGN